ncbi:MAG: signal recognition particle protein [Thermodesulfobacteriota bacterium]
MFDTLSERLESVFKRIKGQGRLDEKAIQEGLREVRLALLEADVNFKVVKDFTERVRERAMGQEVLSSLTPGQQVIKIVHDEMVELLGGAQEGLNIQGTAPRVIMLVGLQGSGKTTSAAKLALQLRREDHAPVLVPADVYRPAAIDQLHRLASEIEVPAYPSTSEMDPVDICRDALDRAREEGQDVVLLDTAGRLHVDETLMQELARIKEVCTPSEILLVADAMTGQDAVNVAERFDQLLDLTGVFLTKMEGDARGGAALSIKSITGKPIKYMGVGEKLKDIEAFYPDRIVSRILGMGDILTLIEKAQTDVSEQEAEELEQKFQRADFDLDDFRKQMRRLRKMGSLEGLLKMLPGAGKMREQLQNVQMPEKELVKLDAMISSMTTQERTRPQTIDASRKERIANGSGTSVSDVTQLLKNFNQMQKMLKKMGGKGKTNAADMSEMAGVPGMPGLGGGTAGGGQDPRKRRKDIEKRRKKAKDKKKQRKKK